MKSFWSRLVTAEGLGRDERLVIVHANQISRFEHEFIFTGCPVLYGILYDWSKHAKARVPHRIFLALRDVE